MSPVVQNRRFSRKRAAVVTGGGMNGRTLLQPSDITYDGAFLLPQTFAGTGSIELSESWGLALRRVAGVTKLYIKTNGDKCIEFEPPAVLDTGAAIGATWVNPIAWKDFMTDSAGNQTKFWSDEANQFISTSHMMLWWDERGQRFYMGTYKEYSDVDQWVCVGYADNVNDATHSADCKGSWRMPFMSGGYHVGSRIVKHPLEIPQWFADTYCGGRYVGLGCGGVMSIQGSGPTSFGLALVASKPMDPAVVPGASSTSTSSGVWTDIQLLANHPFGVGAELGHRDTQYNDHYTNNQPSGGVGTITGEDIFDNCTIWIDTGTKHGILQFPIICNAPGEATIAASPAPTTTSVKLTAPIAELQVGDCVGVESADPIVLDAWPNGVISCGVLSISGDGLTIGLQQLTYGGAIPTPGRLLFRGLWYSQSNQWFTSHKRTIFCFDPADLALVAQGTRSPYSVQPAWWSDSALIAFQPAVFPGGGGFGAGRRVFGMAYDSTNKKIYMFMRDGYQGNPWNPSSGVYRAAVVRYSVA